MRDVAELREDIAVMGMKFGYLDKLILKQYGTAVKSYYCHLCGECESSCPKGVMIRTINRCFMYREGYKEPGLARSTYAEILALASASACLGCPECVASCVHGLDIPDKIDRARRMLA